MDVSVIVQATIGKDGRVTSAHPISGPSDLASAAVSATQRWRFRPYVVDGSPVQVVTNIKFVFKGPH
jgi:protein TonB